MARRKRFKRQKQIGGGFLLAVAIGTAASWWLVDDEQQVVVSETLEAADREADSAQSSTTSSIASDSADLRGVTLQCDGLGSSIVMEPPLLVPGEPLESPPVADFEQAFDTFIANGDRADWTGLRQARVDDRRSDYVIATYEDPGQRTQLILEARRYETTGWTISGVQSCEPA